MATTKNPTELATDAGTLAVSFEYVSYNGQLYAPVDYETGDDTLIPAVDRKCWMPMSTTDIRQKAREQFDTLFKDDAQLRSFVFMVDQSATQIRHVNPWLLVKTGEGLKVLREDGTLHVPDGSFVPNMLLPQLNEDETSKTEMLNILTEWLGDEPEEALSLLRHLATTLAPHWSAGKYVLLIGDGRNGKSLLMTMLQKLFGQHNCSGVDRQTISNASPGMFDLNGKLLNLVFDGPAEFLKDSGREKTLITGEQIRIRRLYSSELSPVQTNALFVEGLNQEPRSKDKSSALQARLVRFWFPRKYPEDGDFWDLMTSDQMLGALLALLIDNYVTPTSKRIMLAPTAQSRQLQLDHMEDNSLAIQFLGYLEETLPMGAENELIGTEFNQVAQQFRSWRISLSDMTVWDTPTLLKMFGPVLLTTRKSQRTPGRTNPGKVRIVTALKPDSLDYLTSLKEDDNATAVVDD